ncbi:esterase [Clavibacter michiganensis subsp. michiganensis]|uniref:esterase n=1 Tax=Clavibacter michiganensis TaxID=28447 RepID=UPI000B6A51BB|nr:esterase [Clavibacter michiganensis]MDO4026408.1 esterase [Clavibacter michiganensis]MDO4035814.1 esterase [Clavibacter michiganensis]MDO4043195.1 esterase [Clavibacter michiganensis]MDO4046649.1 esterase [Clavibacter michiganensis]MDO4052707.1 esterase [Clavibacter michiganensis]
MTGAPPSDPEPGRDDAADPSDAWAVQPAAGARALSAGPLASLRSATIGRLQYRVLYREMRRATFPRDSPTGSLSGPDPFGLAVVGEGTAVGYQTVSHDLGVAGQVAHKLAARTGRGVFWSVQAFPDFTVRSWRAGLDAFPAWASTDVAVLALGIGDAIRFTPTPLWESLLDACITGMQARMPEGALVLVTEVPPLEISPVTPPLIAGPVGRHAEALNRSTRRVVARHDRADSVPFPAWRIPEFTAPNPEDTLYGRVYRAWAELLVERIAPS